MRDGRIAAVGTDADIRKLAGPATRTIDLQGRTVIPGLIDSHMHAMRAALSFSTEVNWIGAASLAEALRRLHDASVNAKPGAWLVVVTPPATLDTFSERRRPTQAELVAAAPNHPVYVAACLRVGDDDAARAEGVQHQQRRGSARKAIRWSAVRTAS